MNATDQTVTDAPKSAEDKETQRKREQKWLHMLKSWDPYVIKNYKKLRERCRKGIPSSVRASAWLHLCGAHHQMANPGNKYEFRRLHVSLNAISKCFVVHD